MLNTYLFIFVWIGLQIFYFRLLGYYKFSCHCRRNRRLRFGPWVRKIPWRRKWQCTPVFLPGKFHGQRNLLCYSSWGHKESDMTEQLNTHIFGYWIKSRVSRHSHRNSLEILTSPTFYPRICSVKKGTCWGTDTLEDPLWPSSHFASWEQYLQIKGKLL